MAHRASRLERAFIAIDSEGRMLPEPEQDFEQLANSSLHLEWPELKRVILRENGGLAAGDWSPDLIPGGLYRKHGKAPDVMAADLNGTNGWHWQDADEMRLYLEDAYSAWLRAQAYQEGPDLIETQECYLVCANDASGAYQRHLDTPTGHLRTTQILDFILKLPNNALIVGFGLGWDYSQWLADLPLEKRFSLCHPETRAYLDEKGRTRFHFVHWKGYSLDLCGSKFTVYRGRSGRTVWDVLRFFQQKFTTALSAWVPELPDDVRTFVERMKASREQLGDDLEQEILYSQTECQYLALMMTRYREVWESLGLRLRSYHGSGSLAGAILKKHHVKKHFPEEPRSDSHSAAVDAAYFGGDFENAVHGPVHLPVYENDLSSAYPAAMVHLPCLRHSQVTHTRSGKQALASNWFLARVKWSVPQDTVWGPFPIRGPAGLRKPQSGEGWYWSPEIRTALQQHSGCVRIIEAYVYTETCSCDPFRFVQEYFDFRLQLEAEGDNRGQVLKIGLNAIYGKFAQRVGMAPFQQFEWAGMITAHVRAQLQEIAGKYPQAVIAKATDAIYSIEPLEIATPRKQLGTWEEKIHPEGFFLARSGVIIPYDKSKVKARGLDRDELRKLLPEFERQWALNQTEATIPVKTRRFVGLTSGCIRPQLWNSWITYRTNLSLGLEPKRERGYRCPDTGIYRSLPPRSPGMSLRSWLKGTFSASDQLTRGSEQPEYASHGP